MNGMSKAEAVQFQEAYGTLVAGLVSVRNYLDSTIGEGGADEALRPVEWSLPKRPCMKQRSQP